jgi:TRAP-type C4-dicarboxylate transport system substrate-binding protein
VFDAALFAPAYHPGKTPLLTIGGGLPFMTPNIIAGGKAYIDYGNNLPEVVQELDQWNSKYLFTTLLPSYQVIADRPIMKVEDIEGLKCRALLGFAVMFNSLGGEVINIPAPDAFDALQKGIINSITISHYGAYSNKYYQVPGINHYNLMNLGTLSSHVAINKQFYEKLPADIQDVMMRVAYETPEAFGGIFDAEEALGLQEMIDYGTQIHEFPDRERTRLMQLAEDLVWPDWIKEREDKGLHPTEAIQYLQERYEFYLSMIG